MVVAVRITAFQKNAFQFNAFQIGQAQYRLITPHTIGATFYDQDTIVTEGFELPINWVPSLAVDPLNSPAVDAFYAAGPRSVRLPDEFAWQRRVMTAPITYWLLTPPNKYTLTGLGVAKAPIYV